MTLIEDLIGKSKPISKEEYRARKLKELKVLASQVSKKKSFAYQQAIERNKIRKEYHRSLLKAHAEISERKQGEIIAEYMSKQGNNDKNR